ncbi:Uncharacterised protein [Mycobacteroides abscessus subsp. massiliense]|nr:Uncharacterised protein [Mycobacteroides abscessus subsp. massiliense]
MSPDGQQVVVPAERRLGGAEPAVVVGHVARSLGDPGHGEDVAVIGRVRPDEMPPHQHSPDECVQRPRLPPALGHEALVSAAVGRVQGVQRDQRDSGEQDAEDHRDELGDGGRAAVPGVDGGREFQALGCGAG